MNQLPKNSNMEEHKTFNIEYGNPTEIALASGFQGEGGNSKLLTSDSPACSVTESGSTIFVVVMFNM